ncbi:hypothetical protein VA7868_01696 [Vibrio aerogenes CECT 7868]|uniref:Uncharacterized protein n=1 Tax=Vibrio aerogenes CECT 7868 TaxID=1216006 RepID=A0A1M5YFY6_9VIBR|nr:hypothetical protein VA7868_01696 [Vibrio aerogenes CECT 7868]
MIDPIFLPLIIPFLYRSHFCQKDILINILYLTYCVMVTWISDIPPGPRIGGLVAGIPMFAYVAYYFPELFDPREQYPTENLAVTALIAVFIIVLICC